MKLLARDVRIRENLSKWTDSPIILSHFLWISGTKDQRSLHKVLCSLLYQLFKGDDELVDQLRPRFPFLDSRSNADEWSKAELKQVLLTAIQIFDKRVCIFLDGLDEIDGEDRVEFHRFIKGLVQGLPRLKLCVSSRPEVQIERVVGRVVPKLRLQDLTKEDISVTVRDFLSDFTLSDTRNDTKKNEEIRDEIIDLVIDRSEGVFLWVHLVLRRIHNGRETIDSLNEVFRRIARMPKDVEDLYNETWHRHGEEEEDYRAEAAHYFQLVIEWHVLRISDAYLGNIISANDGHLSLFDITIASNEKWRREILYRRDTLILKDLLSAVEYTRQRIQLCCGGLLELRDRKAPKDWSFNGFDPLTWTRLLLMPLSAFFSPDANGKDEHLPSAHDLVKLWEAAMCTQISFIHRTAWDFLCDKPLGKKIMESCTLTKYEVIVELHQSFISRYVVYGSWQLLEQRQSQLFTSWPSAWRQRVEMVELSRLTLELTDRLLDRYRVITAIVDHATFDMRQNTDGGTWSEFLADLVMAIKQKHHSAFADLDESRDAVYLCAHLETRVSHAVWPYIREYGLQGTIQTGIRFPQWPVHIPGRLSVDARLAYLYLTSWIFTEARLYLALSVPGSLCQISLQLGYELVLEHESMMWWFCMNRTLPFSFDIIYHCILQGALERTSRGSRWKPENQRAEDPDIFSIWLLKAMHECTTSCTTEAGEMPQQIKCCGAAFDDGAGARSSSLYDYAAFEELMMAFVVRDVDLDSRVRFLIRLRRDDSILGGVWGCPSYDGVSGTIGTEDMVIECNVAQLIRFAHRVVHLYSVSGEVNFKPGPTASSEESFAISSQLRSKYPGSVMRFEGYPVYRKVLLITRNHQGSNDNIGVSPNKRQSEAICSLLEGKRGSLLQQELSFQINSVFEARPHITDPHKWLADRKATPDNWSETGELYNRIFKQDAVGAVVGDVLGKLDLSSPSINNGENNRKWFKAELEKRNGLGSVKIPINMMGKDFLPTDLPIP